MADREAVLKAAIEKNKAYLAAKGALVYFLKIEAFQAELDSITPPSVDGLFIDFGDNSTETYIHGGSPDNPNGVDWTFADARKWWEGVADAGLNVSKVSPGLLPGSAVLSADGLAYFRDLAVRSTTYAPADYNPLGLEVKP